MGTRTGTIVPRRAARVILNATKVFIKNNLSHCEDVNTEYEAKPSTMMTYILVLPSFQTLHFIFDCIHGHSLSTYVDKPLSSRYSMPIYLQERPTPSGTRAATQQETSRLRASTIDGCPSLKLIIEGLGESPSTKRSKYHTPQVPSTHRRLYQAWTRRNDTPIAGDAPPKAVTGFKPVTHGVHKKLNTRFIHAV
ncbi:hypothetical protein CC1G_15068 [Coprinopsis cinerea okayama7|uniref:Uncharacterized protein n=1 Tax=Coprinopsis cinerea (strain Okayama-7 / 130 / ATCC MYA-4618 / FGSC 9003) TaxID=240176 RepID=D6RP82_COPC7|nr:hypothetical protein CC1G_15068 [Coprinopsis cinerea okayama7\|eukprot:XP_002910734.1 hypothetical protein CC1G_15068 [Coprinopsis cinerea okayama7\